MKQSISWHQENLRHNIAHIERQKVYIAKLMDKLNRDIESANMLDTQLRKAQDLGRTSFDAGRFRTAKL